MSCFCLSKTLCKKITSVMTDFWWSNSPNRRRLPWVAWKKLCKQKEEGGLGFHDISKFNQALLGKQAYRIWFNPQSLLARLLKSRYFPDSEFRYASIGRRPSYAWRSIIHGREALCQGLLKTIGDGSSTNVWYENWVMDTRPRPPVPNPGIDIVDSLLVSDLLIHDQWNVQEVRRIFVGPDAERILGTRIHTRFSDSLIWGLTKDGVFSTKSCYKLLDTLPDIQANEESALSPLEKSLWKRLWKLKTSPKIRHFLWRALSGALAVKERLQSRGIPIDPLCESCRMEAETVNHMLFTCVVADQVWEFAGLPKPALGFSQNSVFLNLHHMLKCMRDGLLPMQSRQALPWILWQLWKGRNTCVFEKKRLDGHFILAKAFGEAEEWLAANQKEASGNASSDAVHAPNISWSPPAPPMIKCNIGVALSVQTQNCGVSWITRDHSGSVLHHSRRSFTYVTSHLEAELLGMLWAAESLRNLRYAQVVFELSPSEAIQVIEQPTGFPRFEILGQEINSLLSGFPRCFVLSVPRSSNSVAHKIATSVVSEARTQSYIATGGPNWLRREVIMESRIP